MTRCRSGTGSRDHTLSADQAREAAQRFVQDNVPGFWRPSLSAPKTRSPWMGDTGNYRAEAEAHRYRPNSCTFTPKGISLTTRHN